VFWASWHKIPFAGVKLDRAASLARLIARVLACEIGEVLTVIDRGVRSLYLDLIRRNLTRFGMHERMPARWPLRRRLLLKTMKILMPVVNGTSPFAQNKRDLRLDWPAEAETMIGMQRLTSLQRCVETVLAEHIPGDLVECGVWRGGACILMRAVLAAYGDETRCVFIHWPATPGPRKVQSR
jgi:O-methyltransferase